MMNFRNHQWFLNKRRKSSNLIILIWLNKNENQFNHWVVYWYIICTHIYYKQISENNSSTIPDLCAIRSLRVRDWLKSTSNLTVPFWTASAHNHIHSHCCGKCTQYHSKWNVIHVCSVCTIRHRDSQTRNTCSNTSWIVCKCVNFQHLQLHVSTLSSSHNVPHTNR